MQIQFGIALRPRHTSMGKRTTAGLAGGVVGLFGLGYGNSAQATSNYGFVVACKCATTADFVNAARSSATANPPPGSFTTGTYVIISSMTARTAYIWIAGSKTNIPGRPVHWVIASIGPIDASGNSIAAESESAQEAIYTAIDTNITMVNRSDPIIFGNVELGPDFPKFFSASDADISAAYFNNPATDASINPAGATITLTWNDGSGIVAVYKVVWLGDDHSDVNNFALDFFSATQNGKPINRNGTPLGQSSGGTGTSGGSALVYGFGPAANWSFVATPDASLPGVTITVGEPVDVPPIDPTTTAVPQG